MSLLDIASGPGDMTAFAARQGLRVVGVDFCSKMTSLASERHPGVEFLTGDAESLPFGDNLFDAVTMNFGMLHLANPDRAIAEAARVLRPGGRFAFTVWADSHLALGFQIASEAVEKFGAQVSLPDGPGFFTFSDPSAVDSSLRIAGFVEATTTILPMCWEHESTATVFKAFLHGSARSGAIIQRQSHSAQMLIAAEIEAQVERFLTPFGTVNIPMAAVLSSGVLP
jgi:SAM-dependent methyltransferase